MFSYQEKTGLSPKEIMKIPYIVFVIGMLDAPQIDYDTDKKKKIIKPTNADEEMSAIMGAFK